MQLSLLPILYGLDIETDTTVDGLDPAVAPIVAVSLSGPDDQLTFRGPERQLLLTLDRHLRRLPPGVLITWNGSGFDLPFLTDRAATCRVRLGLHLRADPSLPHRHAPLRGHAAPYRARWHRHTHLDACCLYRTLVSDGTSCALKSLARQAGLTTVELDASSLHTQHQHSIDRYVASDARLARLLAERVWLEAGSLLDAA